MNYTDGYLKEYEYKIPLHKEGVLMTHIDWARQYCKGKFGWHFDKNNNAVVSFERESDASFWCLRWIDEYNKRNS
jgi:hypothetical protein